jgi:polysaccharide pyruvyl transferase WcaK-like protein
MSENIGVPLENRIVINGFFGKGNCGDEAILQTWYDRLSHRFRIVVSMDMDIVNFQKSYIESDLYKNIDIIHNKRLDIFCRDDIKYYIIGGGGLGMGFGLEQWMHAELRNKKTFYLGTIVHEEFFEVGENLMQMNRLFFESFEMISVRDRYSNENLKKYFGVDSFVFPDIAVGMSTEEIEIKSDRKYVVVTIRDNGENDLEYLKKWIDKIKYYAKINSYEILYIPFDRTDEVIMTSIGLNIKYDKIYWHPKKVKYIISKSEMVFSIGRYHPLIFAISSGVTFYYIDSLKSDYISKYINGKDKCYQLLEDHVLLDFYLTNKNLEDDIKFKKYEKIKEISEKITKESNDFFKKLNSIL